MGARGEVHRVHGGDWEMKPYYEHAGITIYHGDCREVLPTLGKFDAVIADPPYGISYVKGSGGKGKHDRRNCDPVIGDNKYFEPRWILDFAPEILLWGANYFSDKLPLGRWHAWDKLDGLESFDSFSDIEYAWQRGKGACRMFRYLWKGICQAGDKSGGREHPTQKPEPLMRWCIELCGFPKRIVDPYCGTGPTLRAAKELGLQATGIDVCERYCEIAARRLQQEVFAF